MPPWKMRKHREIVIGAGLSAVVYAYLTDCVILGDTSLGPAPFDFFPPDLDLSVVNTENTNYDLFGSTCMTVGASKRDLWERLIFIKSLSGDMPMANKLESIRVNTESQTVTAAGRGASIDLKYDTLRVFNDTSVYGLDDLRTVYQAVENKHRVIDWMDVRSGCRHEFDYLTGDGDFVKHIYFYPSDRICGNHTMKDAVAVSFLTDDQLNQYEFSDTYARMKVTSIMKDNGIRGTRNGRDVNNPEKFKYYALRLESSHREVYRHTGLGYKNSDTVLFDRRTPQDILLDTPAQSSYADKLNHGLLIV